MIILFSNWLENSIFRSIIIALNSPSLADSDQDLNCNKAGVGAPNNLNVRGPQGGGHQALEGQLGFLWAKARGLTGDSGEEECGFLSGIHGLQPPEGSWVRLLLNGTRAPLNTGFTTHTSREQPPTQARHHQWRHFILSVPHLLSQDRELLWSFGTMGFDPIFQLVTSFLKRKR